MPPEAPVELIVSQEERRLGRKVFCFQGRGALELSFLESNKRRPRGEEFKEDILTAAGLTKATDIPGEEGERFR